MINNKKLLLVVAFFSISLLVPRSSKAIDLQKAFTSDDSIVVKIQEGIEYFFAFKIENKVAVLEKHAEKRLVMAQGYAEGNNNEEVQNVLQSYLQIKEKQNNLLRETKSEDVLGEVEGRTIEQQKTMEEIKIKVDEQGKQNVIQAQEQVVNQVAQRIIEVNGSEGQTEFFQKVEHVWAPGTGPGGQAGVVIEGGVTQYAPGTGPGGQAGVIIEGGTMQFAPGTSEGGSSGADIKTMEIKTGGDAVIEGGAPGTVLEGNKNVNSGSNTTRTWIDP